MPRTGSCTASASGWRWRPAGRSGAAATARHPARRSGRSRRRVAKRLPADTGRVEVLQSDQLQTAQNLTQLLKNLARYLWLVPLALFAIAIWLARGRRRTTLRMSRSASQWRASSSCLSAGSRGLLVDHVVKNDAVRPAARDAWTILTALLADGGWTLVLLGVMSLIAVWLGAHRVAGRPHGAGSRRSSRAGRSPTAERPCFCSCWCFGARPCR